MKLVTAETLAAALHQAYCRQNLRMHSAPDHSAAAILAAIPPDPRLDALLAALKDMVTMMPADRFALLRPETNATIDAALA